MNELTTQLEITLTPITVFEDGLFYPAVMIENPFTNTRDIYKWALGDTNEQDALAVARVLTLLKYESERQAMEAELNRLTEQLKNPPPHYELPPGFTERVSNPSEPVDAIYYDPQRDGLLWWTRYPYRPNDPYFIFPPR